ncbi:hypothetical protein HEMROJRC1_20770 [Rodentibacter sp. JRC1]|uniref:type-F conjugative transfer system pilin assembly thiol-disulfide isomerase TrbB n=1 Tax=Rodentibacter sp. JRC1 TaxID=2874504 RepID=UPI001CFE8A4B|nr:type-F conjugative transfer system pilin assembly thiol-disulfide isomerase TrbB [Rodentibacter sp. JRC1]GJI56965.1 hypothetical protein HEMROJRC1_20770 [Rodentibacter sp. JRC1]
MKKNYLILLFTLLLPTYGIANSTLEMIEKLDQEKLARQSQQAPEKKEVIQPKERRFITLSNGKRVDITDWRIVHFMSSTCTYCRQFNPKLKQLSEQVGIPVVTYSFDGQGDESFPVVFDATEEVLREFFAELPRATPTDFIINVNNLVTLPISQGDLSQYALAQRLDETFLYIDKNLKGIEKMPVGEGK